MYPPGTNVYVYPPNAQPPSGIGAGQQYFYPPPNQQPIYPGAPSPQYTTYAPQPVYNPQFMGYPPGGNPMQRVNPPQVVYMQQPQRGGNRSDLQNMGIGAAAAATLCCCLRGGGSLSSCSDHNMNPFGMGGMSHSDCSMDYL